jgi:uncharacterized protein (DUF2141 family)
MIAIKQGGIGALILLGSAVSLARSSEGDRTLTVKIEGIRSDKGVTRLALFRSSTGYPGEPSKALVGKVAPVKGGKSVFAIKGLQPGTYAVSAFHDENNNDKLDLNWIGIPKEGTSASNNAKGRFGPPSFKDASFALSADQMILTIRMQYF